MRSKPETVAESIIRCEGIAFALAVKFGRDDDLQKSRQLLKNRIINELRATADYAASHAEDFL